MKKIFLSLAAVLSAVTMMAQTQPTACDAQLQFKFCFTTYGTDSKEIYADKLPFTWNNYTFPTDGSYPMTEDGTITNVRGCDSIVTMTVSVKFPPTGAAGGNKAKLFSVSTNKQVFFSKGNLQYCPNPVSGDKSHATQDSTAAGIWRFATNQYDYVGAVPNHPQAASLPGNVYYNNGTSDVKSENIKTGTGYDVSCEYTGWIDLFGWGSSGYYGTMPHCAIADNFEYGSVSPKYTPYMPYWQNLEGSYANYDWGVYNAISNGGNTVGKWRTLSEDEWSYVLFTRDNATNKIARAKVNNVPGIVLCPDDWISTPSGVTISLTMGLNVKNWTTNQISTTDWSIMENAGAVFLPIGGIAWRQNQSLNTIEGGYYTTTRNTGSNKNQKGKYVSLSTSNCQIGSYYQGFDGLSVRLVADK